MKLVLWAAVATIGLGTLLLSGCEQKPTTAVLAANTGAGGIIRFSGNVVGAAVVEAQSYCDRLDDGLSAVPTSFYKLSDGAGHDQLMTFECKRDPTGEAQ